MTNLSYKYIPHSKPLIADSDKASVCKVLTSGMVAEGQKVSEFEELVSEYLNLAGGVATGSGSAALFLALKALEIGQNDEVIIPTYVCKSVWDAVLWAGATPVLCDIVDDWCVGIESIKPHINKRTRAIIVVHTFGIAADIKPIIELGIPVIEDCAQSLGGSLNDKMLGSYGKLCICSFHATKLLCTGEGGMVLTKDTDLCEKLKYIKNGMNAKHSVSLKMSDIQAVLGLSQLSKYDLFIKRRKQIAKHYYSELRNICAQLPTSIKDRSIFFRFPLQTNFEFNELRSKYELYGVCVRRGVDTLLHRLAGYENDKYPNSESCFAKTVSIPIYPAMTDLEVMAVIDACRKVLAM